MASSNDADIRVTRGFSTGGRARQTTGRSGKHVFILLDSITRTARAFNNAMAVAAAR